MISCDSSTDTCIGTDEKDKMEGGDDSNIMVSGDGNDKISDFSVGEGDTKSDDYEEF